MNQTRQKFYDIAFSLKEQGEFEKAIEVFKQIDEGLPDSATAVLMVACLYFYELSDAQNALPYARRAVGLLPDNELASICLAHTAGALGDHATVNSEIRRYVQSGNPLQYYQTLFRENNLKPEDFT